MIIILNIKPGPGGPVFLWLAQAGQRLYNVIKDKTMFKLLLTGLLLWGGFWGLNKLWLLSSPVAIVSPTAIIRSIDGEVMISRSGQTWEKTFAGLGLKKGDSFKVGANSRLDLDFFGNSLARLGSESEAVIENLELDKSDWSKVKTKIILKRGRLWSSVLPLCDRQASFSIVNGRAEANVQGTMFEAVAAKDGLGVDVYEGLVEYRLDGQITGVAKGQKVKEANNRALVSELSLNDQDEAWIKECLQKSEIFEIDLHKKRQDLSRQLVAGVLPDSQIYQAKIWGEKLRLNLAKNEIEQQKLRAEFINRRLAESVIMLDSGKTGLALAKANEFARGADQLMGELKKQDLLRNQPEGLTAIEAAIKNQIKLQKELLSSLLPGNQLYEIKERLMLLELDLADKPTDRDYLLLKQAESLLESAKQVRLADKAVEARIMADYKKKIEAMAGEFSGDYKKRLKILEGLR